MPVSMPALFRPFTRRLNTRLLSGVFSALCLTAVVANAEPAEKSAVKVSAETFSCIQDMKHIRNIFVGNVAGNLEASLKVAEENNGGAYPVGTVLQLIPQEAMVKREKGFSPKSNDWEFFVMDVTKGGAKIIQRGIDGIVNFEGKDCLSCHAQAQPKWDMVCETGHGCTPLPFPQAMITAIQKTDPQCPVMDLSREEIQMLQYL